MPYSSAMTFFGIGAALDGVDVIAIAGDHIVMTGPGRFQHAVRAGFLARIQVQKTTDLSFDIRFVAALLKAPRKQHFAQQPFLVGNVHEAPCCSRDPNQVPSMIRNC